MREAAFAVAATGVTCCYSALAGVGTVTWRRTRGLRHGSPTAGRGPPPGGRTSRWTWLPGLAGMFLVAAAMAPRPPLVGGGGVGALRLGAAAAGAFVAATGLAARVRAVNVDRGLVIRTGRRRPFVVPWDRCAGVDPPLVPWGGWRLVRNDGRSRTLMPSDLLGHERVLDEMVLRAGLRFEGRRWCPPPGVGVGERPVSLRGWSARGRRRTRRTG